MSIIKQSRKGQSVMSDDDFLPTVAGRSSEVALIHEHIRTFFGRFQGGCCEVIAPPHGARIRVVKPIQTCHPSSGSNLDENQCIPVGEYTVGRMTSDSSSHGLSLEPIPAGESAKKIFFCAGYADLGIGQGLIPDWRGAQPLD